MHKVSFIILTSLLSLSAIAGREHFSVFADSLYDKYGIHSGHLLYVTDNVRVAKPSLLQRWGIFSADAEATYNHFLNTIILKEENFVEDQGINRIKGHLEFDQSQYNVFGIKAQTIFHELIHGDYDVFIENNHYPLINKEIPRYFKGHLGVNGKAAMHEFLGYTAGQIIEVLDTEISQILMQYGVIPHEDRCFKREVLEKKAKLFNLKEDLSFKQTTNIQYWDKMQAEYIFVKGKDYRITHLPQVYSRTVKAYFKSKYGVLTSKNDLIDFLNNSAYHHKLSQCYKFISSP